MTPNLRRAAVLAVALCFTGPARAEDEPLPRGAVARLVVPPRRAEDEEPETSIDAVALSQRGDRLVAAVADKRLVAWDVGAKASRDLPTRDGGYVEGVAWSPAQDDEFATCSTGCDVRRWSFAAGVTLPLAVGRTHGSGRGPAFSPDGRWLLVGAPWGQFVYWELATGRRVLASGIDGDVPKEGLQYRIAWSPDGRQLAVGDANGTLALRPVAGGAAFRVPRTFGAPIRDVGYAPDQSALVVLASSTLHAFSAPELSVPPKSASRGGSFQCAAHSPTARLVAAGDADGRLSLLDAETLEDAAVEKGHAAAIESIAFSGDGKRVATGDAAGVVLVWDVAVLLGREPERVARATPADVAPAPEPRFAFPPAELRAGRAEGLAEGERIEPYAGALPGTTYGDDDVRAVLVVDGTSGQPLPGATLSQFSEEVGGSAGPAFARSTTDAYGIAFAVWVPDRSMGHWTVEREGLATDHRFGWEDLHRTVVLMPHRDAVGRIVGPYGAPVAGAEVELFVGCGHSPTIARAVTAEDGTFRLRSAVPRGWLTVHAPGCSAEYLEGDALGSLGDEPVTYVLAPGADVRGRVVDLDGWGVAGVGVQAGAERTITRTAADGSFLLRGVPANESLQVKGPIDVGELASVGGQAVDWAHPDLAIVLTIPPVGDSEEFVAGPPVTFDVLRVDSDSGARIADDEAVLVSRTNGYRYFPEVLGDDEPWPGALRFEAPAGSYLLLPGSPFASHAGDALEVTVAAGQEAPQIVRVARQPRLSVRIEGELPSVAKVSVAAAGQESATQNVLDLDSFHVPASGPAAVIVRHEEMQRAFAVGPVMDGVREVTVAWPEPKRILVHGVRGADADVAEPRTVRRVGLDDEDTLIVETHASGALRFEIDDDGDGRTIVDVAVPAEPGATVEAHVRRVPRTTVSFRNASGEPIAELGYEYEIWNSGEGDSDEQGNDSSGEKGSGEFSAATAPSVIDLHPHGWAPRRMLVRGDGEQVAAWGDATLVVEVTDDSGNPLDAVLWFDGMLVQVKKGTVTLRGVDAGRRAILVGASGRQAQALDVAIARGATRTIRVVLPEIAR